MWPSQMLSSCHRHKDNDAGNSTAELPHEASMMSTKKIPVEDVVAQSIPFAIRVRDKAHKLATVEQTNVAGKNKHGRVTSHNCAGDDALS